MDATTAPLAAPDCACPLAKTHTHTDECAAAWDAYTDALLIAERADAQADAAQTTEEIDAAVDALRAVPAIAGRNSRPAILALLRRRAALTDPLAGVSAAVPSRAAGDAARLYADDVDGPTVDGPCPGGDIEPDPIDLQDEAYGRYVW